MGLKDPSKNKDFPLVPLTRCYFKRNRFGNQKYRLCYHNETIKHLFFNCQHAKTIWRIGDIANGLTPPTSISHMFGYWLTVITKHGKNLILLGLQLLCAQFSLHVTGCSFLLQRGDRRQVVHSASKTLEVVILDIFAKNGCRINYRLCF
jgi:hypothetical protein